MNSREVVKYGIKRVEEKRQNPRGIYILTREFSLFFLVCRMLFSLVVRGTGLARSRDRASPVILRGMKRKGSFTREEVGSAIISDVRREAAFRVRSKRISN